MANSYRNFREWTLKDACGMETTYILTYGDTYRDLYQPALIIAACFAFTASVFSILLIFQHLRSYNNPAEQKWVVAVLLMVPIYATESILALWNPRLSMACDILRNCYEAFALYSFGSYLIACLGGERRVIELLEDESEKLLSKSLLEGAEDKPKSEHRTLRNFFLQPCVLGKDLLTIEKFGLVQYMILKTVCAFLVLILELFGVYGDGEFRWYYGYPYIAVVLNFSQMWALYCLVQFYNVTHERLKPIKPLAKFISFKAIVFATWWQGVGIALLCTIGILPKEEKFQTGLQDFLICIEMAVAAVAHVFVFSAQPYQLLPVSEYGKVTTQEKLTLVEGNNERPTTLEKTETEIEAPGTSVKESIQDIVVEGGQHVVKDVVLTINQAIEPVEKGVTKIQETFQHVSVSSDKEIEELEVKVEERDDEEEREVKVEEHVERTVIGG
ncbi:protein LAZ1 homolog 2 isoform X2 [Rhododendron vialii]|uniref:protein LAZ1 homolog 2 isoform X2 n=1 Tax=Rhododendron vialii TaxID=182163 RepID=UPI00265E73D4|nr:protein LAZ1 homolog 2 isoform X2 [Rhododendron vialii]